MTAKDTDLPSDVAAVDGSRAVSTGVDALGSATSLRFVLLLVLVTASTLAMMSDHILLRRILGDPNNHVMGCNFAAGFDPEGTTWGNLAALAGRNAPALDACSAPYQPPLWAPPAVVGAVFGLTAVLCWSMPLWRIRQRRLRPVEPRSAESAMLRILTDRTGLTGTRFVIDWASASMNAVAFGRPGSTYVSLPAGLLHVGRTDPDRFAAVVLHELAHLRHRDVGITYFTDALWRVFAITVLLPYLARFVELFVHGQFFRTDAYYDAYQISSGPQYVWSIALCLFLTSMVYLSRSDILRTREFYADRRAADWGAARALRRVAKKAVVPAHGVRGIHPLTSALLAVHPSWNQREQALRNPEILLRVPALPTFLTGATASVISGQIFETHGSLGFISVGRAGTAVAGALVAGTTCLTLWRRTALDVSVGLAPPSGLRAGLWLGLGLSVGSLFASGSLEPGSWLTTTPWLTLLLALLALIVTCWSAQCARVLITAAPARLVRIATAVGLVGTAGNFAFWLTWWESIRDLFRPEFLALGRNLAAQELGIPDPSSTATMVMAVLVSAMSTLGPLIVWSTSTLWLVPLVAWVAPIARTWLPHNGIPSLRRLLAAAAGAGLFSGFLALIIAVRLSGMIDSRDTASTAAYLFAVLLALLVGPLAVAVLLSAVYRRNGLIVGAVVSGVALLLCIVEMLLVAFGLGCALPSVLGRGSCAQFASGMWPILGSLSLILLGPGVLTATGAAFAVSGIAGVLDRRHRHRPAIPTSDRASAPATTLVARRAAISVIVALAIGANLLTMTASLVSRHPQASPTPLSELGIDTAPVPASKQVREAQIVAWYQYGGGDLWTRLSDALTRIAEGASQMAGNQAAGESLLRSGCADIGRWATDARTYFTVPDPEQQATWEQAQSAAKEGSEACLQALDGRNTDDLAVALARVQDAGRLATSVVQWMTAQRQ
jgi:Zn-dependent protease with chaperone function